MRLIFGGILIVLGIGENRYTRTTTTAYGYEINKVEKCPQNKIEWQESSRRLKCSDDARNTLNRYHCLPVDDLSTLVEFCYNHARPLIVKGREITYI